MTSARDPLVRTSGRMQNREFRLRAKAAIFACSHEQIWKLVRDAVAGEPVSLRFSLLSTLNREMWHFSTPDK
jgi:hypothetical protein